MKKHPVRSDQNGGSSRDKIAAYLDSKSTSPLFLVGDAQEVLKDLPEDSVDCCVTSPPYWGKRQYAEDGIGLESNPEEYVNNLISVFTALKRVLKPTGSLWLNIGDGYLKKNLLGLPWRVAFRLIEDGWILRNEIIWNKVKGGPDNTKDRLGIVHEQIFHFTKAAKGYYYDVDSIRKKPSKASIKGGAVVSATGVTGIRYKRQIELSTELSEEEKSAALNALNSMLDDVKRGKLSDFRMIIRGQQRTTHSNSTKLSGRAKELAERGFYFLRYHPKGSKPRSVWDILPEDSQKRARHYAPFPVDLCRIPISSTCPEGGVVIDPFCGTGTTMLAALEFGRKSIGIDLSPDYLEVAQERMPTLI